MINFISENPISKVMKCIVILFDEENIYEHQELLPGFSAAKITDLWADSLIESKLAVSKITVKKSECSNLSQLLDFMSRKAEENDAETIIFAYSDLPLLNYKITEELIKTHVEYKNEYTFADGYPYGFSPEVLNKGTCSILCQLSKTNQAALGQKAVTRNGLWELIKTDVNSFDVESILADEDFRLLRFSFDCSSKADFISCKKLLTGQCGFEKLSEKSEEIRSLDANEVCKKAALNPEILKTVPSFYNIQLWDSINVASVYSPYAQKYEEIKKVSPFITKTGMSYDSCCTLIDKIAEFSEKAVLSFSAFGEPLNHPDLLKIIKKTLSYAGLSVFIETDGLKIDESFCTELEKITAAAAERTNGYEKVMIAVTLDAFSAETYGKVHNSDGFEKAVNAIGMLQKVIPDNVYPQFTRMNCNEQELESFYRYWSEKANASGGKLVIQKYNDFCGELPECKPADLSPLERNVCWHLRRDLTILSNGDVPLCQNYIYENIVGNVFKDNLEKVWEKLNPEMENHIKNNYCKKCGKCDEYYTYNF